MGSGSLRATRLPMASITIRQLDEDLKKRLRLRAARHGRSMEDEVRPILRHATDVEAARPAAGSPPAQARLAASEVRTTLAAASANLARVLLIIGGGIAAYKSLDLIRR